MVAGSADKEAFGSLFDLFGFKYNHKGSGKMPQRQLRLPRREFDSTATLILSIQSMVLSDVVYI